MKRTWIAVLLLLVTPAVVLGQAETTGRVSGRITDEEGNPISGVQLTFASPAMQGEQVVRTDASGRFVAPFLPPGVYTADVTAPNFRPAQYSFRVNIGETVPLDITLTRGEGIVESVTVTATATEMETTAIGENFNYEATIDELPVTDRTIERVAELAPNISFGPTPGSLTIAGAPSFDTVVLLDGSEISDPYFGSAPPLYLEEAVEEVQVLTSGIDAKYGRFQGGVINAVTKSGGNTFDGSLRADLSKDSWNEQTPAEEVQSDELTRFYSGTLGGPIVKDRLWFFVGGRTIPTESAGNQTVLSGQGFITEADEDRYQVKLTGSINPDHLLEGSYLNFERTSTGRAGLPAGDLFAATGVREDPREIYTLEYQGVLTPSLFLNVQATRKDVSISSGGDPALGSPFLDFYGAGFQIWNNHWWDFNDPSVRDNDTISAGLTQVLSTANWGDHTFEYGVQYVNSNTAGENKQSSTGLNLLNYDSIFTGTQFSNVQEDDFDPDNPMFNLISYDDGGLSYRWVALPLGGDQELENTALYVQDTWEINKWRLDLGLRWEQYEGTGPSPIFDLDFDQLSPRLGVTYNIDRNWQLQATWGKYVARFNDNVAGSITGVSGAPYVVQIYTGPTPCTIGEHCLTYDDVEALLEDDDNWGIVTTVTDPTQPTRFLAEDIEAPYAKDLNLTVRRALPRNRGTFTLTYTNRKFENLLDDFVGVGSHPELTGDFAVTSVVDPLGSGDIFDLDTTIWDNSDFAVRDYDAVTATVDYRPTTRWNVGGNWTYARSRGNYEGEGRNTPASGSEIGNYPDALNPAAAFPYGYLDDDLRHRVRGWASYDFDFERAGSLTLGSLGLYQSGAPYNLFGGVGYANLPEYLNEAGTQYTYFIDGRGQNRFSGFWRLDLSARYQILLARDVDMFVKFDVLNVTNNDEMIAFNTSGSVMFDGMTPVFVYSGCDLADPTCQDPAVDPPVPSDTNFGEFRNDLDFQLPRSYFIAVGFEF